MEQSIERLNALNERLLKVYPHPQVFTVGGDDLQQALDRAIDQIEASVVAMETVQLHSAVCSEGAQR